MAEFVLPNHVRLKSVNLEMVPNAPNRNPQNALTGSEPQLLINDAPEIGTNGVALPVLAGQSSVYDISYQQVIQIQGKTFIEILPEFSIEWLPILQSGAVFSPELSPAMDNIVNLANTRFAISFGNSSDADKEKFQSEIDKLNNQLYVRREGVKSLIGDLLLQLVSAGCLSAEIVPTNQLDGVKSVIRVDPYTIRISREKDTGEIQFFQRPNRLIMDNYQNVNLTNGLILLNNEKYRYYGLRRVGKSLYGFPPMLAALQPLTLLDDIFTNFSAVAKKSGLLGVTSVEITQPTQLQGESIPAYTARCLAYLNSQMGAIMKFSKDGIIAGFKGQFDSKFTAVPTNVSGMQAGIRSAEVRAIGALKQDPSLLGRQASSNETQARVNLAIQSAKISDYQNCVARFLEDVYAIHLNLKGLYPDKIGVEFELPNVTDNLKDAQTDNQKFAYAKALYDQGIWSQSQVSLYLTGEMPFADGPIAPITIPAPKPANPDDAISLKKKAQKEANKLTAEFLATPITEWSRLAERDITESSRYDYGDAKCGCGSHTFAADKGTSKADKKRLRFSNGYFREARQTYQKAIQAFSEGLTSQLQKLPEDTNADQLYSFITAQLLRQWDALFKQPINKVVNNWVPDIYTAYRSDKTPFTNSDFKAPQPNFNLKDENAIRAGKKLDTYYMGKFITDDDTRQRVFKAVQDIYLDNPTPIGRGKDNTGIREIKGMVNRTYLNEDWKIRRITDTTVTKLRVEGNMRYMQEAGLETFKILEVMDRLTCPICESINGKEFNIENTLATITAMNETEPELFPVKWPFSTNMKQEDFDALSTTEIENAGYALIGHPHCRRTIVME